MRRHRWKTDERTGEVDVFALDVGHHNGPRCLDCGEAFCEHCEPDCYTYECNAAVGLMQILPVKPSPDWLDLDSLEPFERIKAALHEIQRRYGSPKPGDSPAP